MRSVAEEVDDRGGELCWPVLVDVVAGRDRDQCAVEDLVGDGVQCVRREVAGWTAGDEQCRGTDVGEPLPLARVGVKSWAEMAGMTAQSNGSGPSGRRGRGLGSLRTGSGVYSRIR